MVIVYKNCYEHIGVVSYTSEKCPECEREALQPVKAVEHVNAPDMAYACPDCGSESLIDHHWHCPRCP